LPAKDGKDKNPGIAKRRWEISEKSKKFPENGFFLIFPLNIS
jgi:hypothetical protein